MMDKKIAQVEAEAEMAAIQKRIERYSQALNEEYGKLNFAAALNRYTQAENAMLRGLLKDVMTFLGQGDYGTGWESLHARYETFLEDYGGDE